MAARFLYIFTRKTRNKSNLHPFTYRYIEYDTNTIRTTHARNISKRDQSKITEMDKTTVQTNGAAAQQHRLQEVNMVYEKSYASLQSVEATLTANGHGSCGHLGEGFGWLSELQIARTQFQLPRPKVLQGCGGHISTKSSVCQIFLMMTLFSHRPHAADPRVLLQALRHHWQGG